MDRQTKWTYKQMERQSDEKKLTLQQTARQTKMGTCYKYRRHAINNHSPLATAPLVIKLKHNSYAFFSVVTSIDQGSKYNFRIVTAV